MQTFTCTAFAPAAPPGTHVPCPPLLLEVLLLEVLLLEVLLLEVLLLELLLLEVRCCSRLAAAGGAARADTSVDPCCGHRNQLRVVARAAGELR